MIYFGHVKTLSGRRSKNLSGDVKSLLGMLNLYWGCKDPFWLGKQKSFWGC
jgi:hypothetical protein